jgi:GNAT superfamily N-acetyltransferase
MTEADLYDADRIFRLAFGTFLALPDPASFGGDADFVRTRWRANPHGALVAELDGHVVGSNLVTNWGSVGFFGPLTVSPDEWGIGVAQDLLTATMQLFEEWSIEHAGLFTFAQSAKHVGLYQKFGFWPRYLTAVMSRPVTGSQGEFGRRLTATPDGSIRELVEELGALTDAIHPGLDLAGEFTSVREQRLGEVVVLDGDGRAEGLAVCHLGAGTEAGSGTCYVKFGGVRPGPGAADRFARLVGACDRVAHEAGARVLVAGANAEREHAWRALSEMGFTREMQGVTMHRPNASGYSTADAFIIDDWR